MEDEKSILKNMFKIQKYSPLYSFVFEKENRKNT